MRSDKTGQQDPTSRCTIIIPTLALTVRANSLMRAIRSVQAGNSERPAILVVVNGTRFDPALLRELGDHPDVSIHQISTPSLPAALLAGRSMVSTPYFGFLDDDDEYLPGGLDKRLTVLNARQDISVVVTNGYRHVGGNDTAAMRFPLDVEADPLAALFSENWLASCGALFRSRDIEAGFFADLARYFEWSWLGFRIAESGRRIAVLNEPTFRIHDTMGSESKSDASMESQVPVLTRMLSQTTRPEIANLIKKRISQAWHDVSGHYLARGRLSRAWLAHVCSLRHPTGWKFLPYTRHLWWPKLFR